MANIYDMSDTWNDAGTTFTAIKMDVTDTASDASSLLMDLQVGGSSKFKFAKDGSFFVNTNNIGNAIYVNNAGRNVSFATSLSITTSGATPRFITVGSSAAFSRIPLGGLDLYLERDAADTLAQRRSTNAQTFNLYNTYTDASNYERASFTQTATGLVLDSQYAGTGTEPDNILELKSGGVSRFRVNKIGQLGGLYLENVAAPTTASGFANYSFNNTWSFGTSGNNALRVFGNTNTITIFSARSNPIDIALGLKLTTNAYGANPTLLYSDAANTLAQRNGTNAQTFNLYNTYTDASNYERGFMRWNNNVLQIGTEAAGTGTVRTLLLPSVIKIGSFTLSTLGTDRLLNGFNWGYTASIGTGGLVNSSGSQVRWSSGPTYAAIDAGLSRDSAGVIKVTDGSTGTGDLIANQVLLGTNSAPAVKSDTTQAGTNSVAANNIVTISQADYDALTPDPDTIYFIV